MISKEINKLAKECESTGKVDIAIDNDKQTIKITDLVPRKDGGLSFEFVVGYRLVKYEVSPVYEREAELTFQCSQGDMLLLLLDLRDEL